jgi:hypothetical protein
MAVACLHRGVRHQAHSLLCNFHSVPHFCFSRCFPSTVYLLKHRLSVVSMEFLMMSAFLVSPQLRFEIPTPNVFLSLMVHCSHWVLKMPLIHSTLISESAIVPAQSAPQAPLSQCKQFQMSTSALNVRESVGCVSLLVRLRSRGCFDLDLDALRWSKVAATANSKLLRWPLGALNVPADTKTEVFNPTELHQLTSSSPHSAPRAKQAQGTNMHATTPRCSATVLPGLVLLQRRKTVLMRVFVPPTTPWAIYCSDRSLKTHGYYVMEYSALTEGVLKSNSISSRIAHMNLKARLQLYSLHRRLLTTQSTLF